MGNKAGKDLFAGHEEVRKADERRAADYARSLADIGGKVSTDKGGTTEKLRTAHTRRAAK